ncbi:hypothetical protein N5J66_05560 [Pseudomonas juntendi]|uniref:hypothetical protein n=1 Tax=Pseudomonas juntendi TaxID=2666183 RepID=UPI002446DB25|nr:hypothetical protein [Pseudomonas juntendi]MDH2013435.1 hypothetical protein [Pseudomonas juntendi]
MKIQNNMQIFEDGDALPELPDGLTYNLPVISQFGFVLDELEGKPYWRAGTEQEYRAAESQRLGVLAEDVKIGDCYNTSPSSCSVGCFGIGWCTSVYDPARRYYYCACTK